ncbi:MAG: PQQ-dependent sugar dehydrogenase, partial [Nocardioides sp.]|uniref:PQQ-dependent sugar dehydrogenase n=1 Tax=Nocardioides sp. TaxID=35761 RepID=UPI0032676D5A
MLLVAALLSGCADADDPPASDDVSTATSDPTSSEPAPSESASTGKPRVAGIVASELSVPWGIAFLPDGSAIVTERDSRRVLRLTPQATGEADVAEIGEITEAAPEVEAGLLGVAVSPDFATDETLFFYATTDEDNTVFKVTLDGDELGEPTPILTGIPKGVIHDGGRLAFGPDGFLYVSTGETGNPYLAQEPDSLAGKILRLTTDGRPAPGNPDVDSPIWSLGHRNVQGLAFDETGQLWASEFGDQTFDELNRVTAGANYGWPEVEGGGGEPDFVDPVQTWSTAEASPSGLAFADGSLWMAALRGQRV